MKMLRTEFSVVALLGFIQSVSGQDFVNLDFEDAHLSGYSPGGNVPVADAFPGWSASFSNPTTGTVEASSVWYDGLSLGGAAISINDTNGPPYGYGTLDGNFSAYLFGGGVANDTSATISQTGLVPIGTKSLIISAQFRFYGPALLTVSVDGQPLSGVPYSGYDISSFAGKTVTLSFTESAPAGVPPSLVILDDVSFSPIAVPEPSTLGLIGICVLFFCSGKRRPNKTLQATAGVLLASADHWRHNAMVAGASTLPATALEFGR